MMWTKGNCYRVSFPKKSRKVYQKHPHCILKSIRCNSIETVTCASVKLRNKIKKNNSLQHYAESPCWYNKNKVKGSIIRMLQMWLFRGNLHSMKVVIINKLTQPQWKILKGAGQNFNISTHINWEFSHILEVASWKK